MTGDVAGLQISLLSNVISGTWCSVCQRATTTVRIPCRPKQSARSDASPAFQSLHGGSRLECLGFFDEREQSLGADSEIYGRFGVLDALRVLNTALEIGKFGLGKFEGGSERVFFSGMFSARPWKQLRELVPPRLGANPRTPGFLR